MKGIRWKEGEDIWRCSCGELVIMGRECTCGKNYGDILAEKAGVRERGDSLKSKKMKRKIPLSRGAFTESYLYREKGTKE